MYVATFVQLYESTKVLSYESTFESTFVHYNALYGIRKYYAYVYNYVYGNRYSISVLSKVTYSTAVVRVRCTRVHVRVLPEVSYSVRK
jgi:hypothetical protein